MDDKVWRRENSKKIAKLRAADDSKGVLKLQFGRYIRDRRRAIPDLSQSKAAKLARISRSQWARMEAGKHLPRPHKIADIADAIRVQVSALYRKAWLEVPPKYALYDMKAASKDFAIALKESLTFEEFIARMQEVWQLFYQEQPKRAKGKKGFFVDHRQAKLIADIYQLMNAPQRIMLARELVRPVDPQTIRATLRDAPAFLKELDRKFDMLKDGKNRL